MDLLYSLVLLTLPLTPDGAIAVMPIAAPEWPGTFQTTKAAPTRLAEAEIQQRIETLPPEWTTDGETLFFEKTFEDFVAAIAFVNALVEPAETLGHHPDITINYNRVSLALTTHDAGGLTELDFQLATAISALTEN